MIGVDYADDLVLIANLPTKAEFLQHSIVQAAICIDLYANSDKTKFMCFKWDGPIFTNEKPLKLDHFTYLGSNISSTESNVNIGKAWIAIDWLLAI